MTAGMLSEFPQRCSDKSSVVWQWKQNVKACKAFQKEDPCQEASRRHPGVKASLLQGTHTHPLAASAYCNIPVDGADRSIISYYR